MTENFNKAIDNLNRKKVFKEWLEKMSSMNDFFQDYPRSLAENVKPDYLNTIYSIELYC